MLQYDKDTYHLLSMNVRYFRQKNRMQSKDLAQRLSYSPSWVSKLEKGNHREITRSDVKKLAEVLGTTEDILVGENTELYSRFNDLERKIKDRQIGESIELELAETIDGATERDGPREQAHAHWLMGNFQYVCGNYDRAITTYDSAKLLAHNFGDNHYYHKINRSKAKVYLAKGAYHDAEKILRENYPQNMLDEFENLQLLGYLLCQQERWSDAEDVLKKAINISRDGTITIRKRAECLQYLGVVYFNTNDLMSAVQVSRDAMILAQKSDDILCQVYCHRIIGDALRLQDSKKEAREEFRKAFYLAVDSWILEKLELTFKIALCSEDLSTEYEIIKSTLDQLEKMSNHPRSMAKLYDEATCVAIELEKLDDAKEFHAKTVQNYRAVLR